MACPALGGTEATGAKRFFQALCMGVGASNRSQGHKSLLLQLREQGSHTSDKGQWGIGSGDEVVVYTVLSLAGFRSWAVR
jgi:hypothetical protein